MSSNDRANAAAPTRLRILHATPSFAPAYRYGGPVRSVEGLVVELAQLGVDVRVLTTDSHREERLDVGPGWQRWRGVPVRYLRRRAMPDLAPAYVWEAYREARRADVIHIMSFFSAPSMVGLIAGELAGRAVVLSPRGMLEPAALALASSRKKRAWIAAFGPFLRRTTIFHATSAEESASITRVLGDSVRVRVVPNGTDLEPRERADARKRCASPRPVIGALGRIHPIKGLDRLLEAAAILRDRGLDFELHLAGPTQDEDHYRALERLAVRLSLADRLRFPGELHGEAKLDFLAACRVLCLPSHSENFGNVVVEALASLTPVVAARGTPWAELEAQGAGRWVEATPAALADALEPYLRDAEAAARAGDRGRALVESRYGWPSVAAAMCEVYEEAARIARALRLVARAAIDASRGCPRLDTPALARHEHEDLVMPHNLDLIYTLTGGFTAALVFGYLTQRIRLSPIVGYLLAGIVVGPFTPGFVARDVIAEQLAELGVILLMFGVGLHFHVKDLLAVRRIAIPGALVQIAVATGLGVLVTRMFGWSLASGVVFGLAISVASTVVLLRVLADYEVLHTPAGHVAVGWLLVEDIFTVLVLVLLPILVGGGDQSASDPLAIAISVGVAVVKVAALVVFTLVVGRRTIPFLLGLIAKTRSRELFTLTVLVLALGIAVGSATLFGASMALGAFLAGMVVGQSEFSSRAASEALPMRDAFAVLFFVSMGMLLDPSALLANAGITAATLAVILIGKPLAALAVVLALRYPAKTAVSVALALAQIGEFSFILVALGRRLHVLPDRATQALVAAAIISITLNPLLFRLVDPLSQRLSKWLSHREAKDAAPPPHTGPRAIVIGYGPVGRTLAKLLREQGLSPTVVELNHETVADLNEKGIHSIYGDASQREILESAGAREAFALVFAASGSSDAVIREAKELNPRLLILSRASYVREIGALKKAGATMVVSSEGEVAFAMAERLLQQLGATGEQLDRARDRIRSELPAG